MMNKNLFRISLHILILITSHLLIWCISVSTMVDFLSRYNYVLTHGKNNCLLYPLTTHFHNYGLTISYGTFSHNAHTLFPQSLQFVPLSSPSYYPITLSHCLPQRNPLLTQTPLNQTPPTTKLMIAQPQDYFHILCSCTACYVTYVSACCRPHILNRHVC